MVCLGFEPGATGWWAQTKPRSYGGHPKATLIRNLQSSIVIRDRTEDKIEALKTRLEQPDLNIPNLHEANETGHSV